MSIYRIIETSKTNQVPLEKYLVYLMDMLSNLEDKSDGVLLKYIPWSMELLEDVKLKNKNLHSKKD